MCGCLEIMAQPVQASGSIPQWRVRSQSHAGTGLVWCSLLNASSSTDNACERTVVWSVASLTTRISAGAETLAIPDISPRLDFSGKMKRSAIAVGCTRGLQNVERTVHLPPPWQDGHTKVSVCKGCLYKGGQMFVKVLSRTEGDASMHTCQRQR